MKLHIALAVSLLTLINCNTTKTTGSTMNEDKNVVGKLSVQRISLSEQTRGTNRLFTITPTKTETDLNGNLTSKSLSPDSWKVISDKIAQINLEEIQSYKSPTTKRYSDAALASVIIIEKDGKTYSSADFDSGNPPQQLADVYNEIKNTVGTKKGKK
ncbi:hypothetical protein [Chryseobacterium caseinilyticum]|uniref:Lipoprotein n=1 Tax=Chryseobacterium caseinilyticum TaxID=2771428 RepID=A0ABR8ZGK2_9FLAO|nr:hypothetical protein [Chryseobacterium caseinilyticum]MBD8083816.1 hypothetical protein [Chryseobacterium caseinilyticum]